LIQGLPIILGCCAVMECETDSVHSIGDHNVWYGQVLDAHIDDNVSNPMLYQSRYVHTQCLIMHVICCILLTFFMLVNSIN